MVKKSLIDPVNNQNDYRIAKPELHALNTEDD